MKRRASTRVLAGACLALAAGCQSMNGGGNGPEQPAELTPPPPPVQFQPASYVSQLHFEEGRYPNLFSADSYAVWVGPEVAALKKENETGGNGGAEGDASGGADASDSLAQQVPAELDAAAEFIGNNYMVFECHLVSAFPDASIAYDIVGLRNTEIYLVTPEGMRVRPIQRVLGTSADESQRGAIKRFARTVILVFPKMDILAQTPTVSAEASGVRLVFENFNSTFYYEWGNGGADASKGMTKEEIRKAVKMGFTDLFSRLQALSRMFH